MLYFEIDGESNSKFSEYKSFISNLLKYHYYDYYIFSNFGNLIMKIHGNILIDNLENFQEDTIKKVFNLNYVDVFAISKYSKFYSLFSNNKFFKFKGT